jgi:hypothetical protein
LPAAEWERRPDGALALQRRLPDGVRFGARLRATAEAVEMELWLTNGSTRALAGLRVQNCVLLGRLPGFAAQSNENKVLRAPYAAARSDDGRRWVITAWEPHDRLWANPPCPCIHSDPKFPDCPPGQTRRLRGRLWFYEGTDLEAELARLEATGWRTAGRLVGSVVDAESGRPLAARVYLQDAAGAWRLPADGLPYRKERGGSTEIHATLPPGPFEAELPRGRATITVERGKEYRTLVRQVEIGAEPVELTLPLSRWIDMAALGWYSGDTHVHRPPADLPNLQAAEDLNVAFPLVYWVTDGRTAPKRPDPEPPARPVSVDAVHVYWPRNTEYEIFRMGGASHTLGAFFILGHQEPFEIGVPPVEPVLAAARRQGALLELDKHNWPWSMAMVPLMPDVLYELSNNHVWRSPFGFAGWGERPADYMGAGDDERGWIEFGLQNYYALLNCGFRLRPTAGTASGVHPVPLGFSRVYVRLDGPFSYEAWVEGLRDGRSFVTTGPMLPARLEGADPGRLFGRAGAYRLTGAARSAGPIDRIEILVNGQVVRRPAGPGFDETLRIEESSWVAVRCYERAADGRERFAHTAPWWIEVEGRPLRPRRREVEYLMRRVREQIERSAGVLPPEGLAEYRAALAAYERLAARARD